MRIRSKAFLCVLASGLLAQAISACGSGEEGSGILNPSAGGSAAEAGASGNGAVGAISGNGGNGAGNGGSGGFDPDAGCTGVRQRAENDVLPADIIIAVDQSTSMTDETQFVQTQLNTFAGQIISKGVNAQIVLIAERPSGYDSALDAYECQGEEWPNIENPICIPQPLAGASCGDNVPEFLSLNCHVDSHDAFDKLLALFEVYRTNLRPNASRHFVVITDDSPDMDGNDFDTRIRALDPGFADYFFHAIVPFTDCDFASGSATDYLDLVQQRNGVSGDLCTQNFQSVWDELGKHVTSNTKIACQWEIPPPPGNMVLNPDEVNVRYTDGSGARDLGRVPSAAECGTLDSAWYYDDPTRPTRVIACPALCEQIESGEALEVDVVFGCDTRSPPPA